MAHGLRLGTSGARDGDGTGEEGWIGAPLMARAGEGGTGEFGVEPGCVGCVGGGLNWNSARVQRRCERATKMR